MQMTKYHSCDRDEQGRFLILKAFIQGQSFVLVNVYAPKKIKNQCTFFEEIHKQLDELVLEENCEIIIGGDFNLILEPDLNGTGGKPQVKDSRKKIDNLCSLFDLIDIWRIRNPDATRFTRRQKNPIIQRRLDFCLISLSIQEEVVSVHSISFQQ